MALSARHAPPSKLGKRHVRAAPGGLQDAYIGAVRWCLTSATLKSRTHARAPDAASAGSASTAYEERPRGAGAALPGCQGDIQGPLVVAVREAHESAEGLLLVARVVAEAEVLLQALGHRAHGIVGGAESSARLLLHRQHPALQGGRSGSQALAHCCRCMALRSLLRAAMAAVPCCCRPRSAWCPAPGDRP
ncbi:unnamed protein product [Prorocentrum cordatum]|uniref:Uncharacterized protein n=1 Tax=Prorocentrum cordatum TaxID=2364126 RepID=A0ABN9PDR1_9DINO|nr:unnamed protein product [Polarella glacialis]